MRWKIIDVFGTAKISLMAFNGRLSEARHVRHKANKASSHMTSARDLAGYERLVSDAENFSDSQWPSALGHGRAHLRIYLGIILTDLMESRTLSWHPMSSWLLARSVS